MPKDRTAADRLKTCPRAHPQSLADQTASWRAGEGRLRTNHVQAGDGAEERGRSVEAQASGEQASDTQAASGLLMCLAVVMFVASPVISLSLLWFAIRGIQWLLWR